jgi:fatty acid-binding protein DegV
VSVQQIRERLEMLAQNVHGYMVTRDLYYMRARARHKGDRSVGLLSAALGSALDIKPVLHGYRGQTGPVAKIKGFDNAVQKLFDFVGQRVKAGLMTPTVCVSYGGELADLRALPGYATLQQTCQAHGAELFESVMSLTGMVNVGKGAVTIGFADEPHAFNG